MRTLRETAQKKREQWAKFKKEINQKVYTRVVIAIERDETIIGQSNFHSWIVQTEKGKANLTISRATNAPQIGSIIEFRVSPFQNSYTYTEFYISHIVKEVKSAGDEYLFQLWENEKLNQIYNY